MPRQTNAFPHRRTRDTETGKPEEEIHAGDTYRPKEKSLFTTDPVGKRTVQHNGEPVHKRHQCFEDAKLRIFPAKKIRERRRHSSVIVPRHIEKRVKKSERHPVDNALSAKFRSMNR